MQYHRRRRLLKLVFVVYALQGDTNDRWLEKDIAFVGCNYAHRTNVHAFVEILDEFYLTTYLLLQEHKR